MGLTKVIDGFEFEAITYPYNKQDAIQVMFGAKSINAYKEYINRFRIEKAHIIMPDLELLRECPTLKHLRVTPYNATESFDFSPLYDAPEILDEYKDVDTFVIGMPLNMNGTKSERAEKHLSLLA